MAKHKGPICVQCGAEFYYDYIPEPHEGTGYCWFCWSDWQRIRARARKSKSVSLQESSDDR